MNCIIHQVIELDLKAPFHIKAYTELLRMTYICVTIISITTQTKCMLVSLISLCLNS